MFRFGKIIKLSQRNRSPIFDLSLKARGKSVCYMQGVFNSMKQFEKERSPFWVRESI